MKKFCSAIAVILTAVLVLTPAFSYCAFADSTDPVKIYEEKLKAAKEKREEYEKQKDEAQAMITQLKEEMSDIESYIMELDLKMNDLQLQMLDTQQAIEDTEAELERTREELEAAKQREADQYATMKARLKYIYENGETSYLDVLANSASIGDVLNQLEYVAQIQAYDNSLLERYRDAKTEVEQYEDMLEASLDEYGVILAQQELEEETVNELMEIKSAEIERLTEELGIADELLFTYLDEIAQQDVAIEEIIDAEEKRVAEEERKRKEEEERIRKAEEAARLAAALAAAQSASEKAQVYDSEAINSIVLTDETDHYSMIWPLPGDHRTYSKFGYRKAPTKGASTYHQGWDIGGEFGAPIVAVLAGTVYAASYSSSGGNYVKIKHDDGFMTTYCHCSKLLVVQGQYVQQGEIIGLCGSTGVSTGPHLHFGVQSKNADGDWVYIDPNPYIGPLE